MKRFLIPSAVAALALALAACGSDGSGDSSSNSTPAAAGSATATVSIASVDGTGDVLVDSLGNALYTPDVEADGTIHCVDACESFWRPLAAGASGPTAADGVPALSTLDRPDGSEQVAVDGHPLYTFTQDAPGNITGDNFSDDFGGKHFTWHVVHSDGSTGAAAPAGTTPAGSTPPTAPGDPYGGGPGY